MAAGVVPTEHALITKLKIDSGGTGVAIGFETKEKRVNIEMPARAQFLKDQGFNFTKYGPLESELATDNDAVRFYVGIADLSNSD